MCSEFPKLQLVWNSAPSLPAAAAPSRRLFYHIHRLTLLLQPAHRVDISEPSASMPAEAHSIGRALKVIISSCLHLHFPSRPALISPLFFYALRCVRVAPVLVCFSIPPCLPLSLTPSPSLSPSLLRLCAYALSAFAPLFLCASAPLHLCCAAPLPLYASASLHLSASPPIRLCPSRIPPAWLIASTLLPANPTCNHETGQSKWQRNAAASCERVSV
jgi:hypothetical protein